MQPYRKGEPFGELEQVSMDDVQAKIQGAFNQGADMSTLAEQVVILAATIEKMASTITDLRAKLEDIEIRYRQASQGRQAFAEELTFFEQCTFCGLGVTWEGIKT